MRNTHIDLHDALDRALVAIGNDYPAGHLLDAHAHRRAQLLYSATGVMLVLSEDGGWVVLLQRRLDPGRRHAPGADAGVSTRSAYIEPGAARADARACEVVEVSPLLRQLLLAAVDMPAQYDREGRDGALARLLLHEVDRAPALPLHILLPRDARLGRCARPSWRRRTSARGRRTGPGGCT